MPWRTGILWIVALLGAIPAAADPGQIVAFPAGPQDPPPTDNPQTPGFQRLIFQTVIDGKPLALPFSLYLPRGYDPAGGPEDQRPMIVYLLGVGDRGSDLAGVFHHGPPAELQRQPQLAAWAPYLVLTPQCATDQRWDQPGMARAVLDLIDAVSHRWRVDRARVYLTGLSMGGTACWRLAAQAPRTFAAIASFSGEAYEPDTVADKLHDSGVAVWIVTADNDTRFTEGARAMQQALAPRLADLLVYTEVPGGSHECWVPYYASRKFYDWLLAHHRDAPPGIPRPRLDPALSAPTAPAAAIPTAPAPPHPFLPFPHWKRWSAATLLLVGLLVLFAIRRLRAGRHASP